MKKLVLAAAIAALSSTAFAGGSVGIGYQATTAAPNYGDCWSECYGDGEPAGFALNASYEMSGVFAGVDYADLSDEEDHYEDSVEVNQKRLGLDVGYKYTLNDASNLTAAVRFSSFEWDYTWTNDTGEYYSYVAEDDGVSLVLGANTKITDKLSTGAALTAGFETGISAYMSVKLTDNVSVQTTYSRVAYELGDFYYSPDWNGNVPTDPSSATGDGDMQFNDENYRISVNYAF